MVGSPILNAPMKLANLMALLLRCLQTDHSRTDETAKHNLFAIVVELTNYCC